MDEDQITNDDGLVASEGTEEELGDEFGGNEIPADKEEGLSAEDEKELEGEEFEDGE